MTAISVSERLLEMAAFYTPLALTVTFIPLIGTDKGKEVMKNLFKEQLKRQKK